MRRYYGLRVLGVFVVLFAAYLLVANGVLEPRGYYGSRDHPRFADPWIARAETIVSGGLLYRDISTMTPPLINYLLVPPALFSGWAGHKNPWATLSFMSWFSLFNLFTAYALLYTSRDREGGYRSALFFLFNPLTFGNTVLRRQDESILVFFFSLALLFAAHQKHWRSSIAIGLTLLVKLSGALIIPVAFLRTRDWRYLVIPAVVFGLVFAPFLLAAGKSAVFWDFSKTDTQHPFQFGGISPGALWSKIKGPPSERVLDTYSAVLVVGVLVVLAYIAWRPMGLFEDVSLLTTTVLLLSPKLHCGYFSLLALMMAPLARRHRLWVLYFLASLLILIADMFKFPADNYPMALALVIAGSLAWIASMIWLRWPRRNAQKLAAAN
jgi:hypothetical protein